MKCRLLCLAFGFGVGAATLLLVTGCGNMKDQRNVRTLESAPGDPDATSALPPPEHAVSRGARAPGDPFVTGYGRDGQLVARNPLPVTRALIERGRERFDIYCAVCHGRDGYGAGIVERRGFPPPPSYHIDRLRQAPDGHFFDVMTRGYGVMLPYVDRLTPHDRWAVVAFIRTLQRSQHTALADLPPDERSRLPAP
jgi:hypothetical protein